MYNLFAIAKQDQQQHRVSPRHAIYTHKEITPTTAQMPNKLDGYFLESAAPIPLNPKISRGLI